MHTLPRLFGYALFTGMMATGYYYNVTFIQLGLYDLGVRLIGLTRPAVAANMALLALLTLLTALLTGFLLRRTGHSANFFTKLRLAFLVVLAQTVLTALAPHLRTPGAFLAWIIAASLALGAGVPATFSLTVDLIPVRHRGYIAALITAAAYLAANLLPLTWQIEVFSRQMLFLMLPATPVLGVLAFVPLPLTAALARQHTLPGFGRGRYVRPAPGGGAYVQRRLILLIALMFGIFFVDSLGFLRLLETPSLMQTAWQSPDYTIRVFIGLVHLVTALIAGVLYTALDEKSLLLWIFGLFALVHLMYTLGERLTPGSAPALSIPMLYATAVSLYTVVNFAIWADISTPADISWNTALGVALSGWTATFLSTALAIRWESAGMPLLTHLNIVDSLAILFFLAVLGLSLLPNPAARRARPPAPTSPKDPDP